MLTSRPSQTSAKAYAITLNFTPFDFTSLNALPLATSPGQINTDRPSANISVIIPSYNREHLLLDALDAINRQTLLPRAVWIVDDGSTDNSFSVVEHWARQQPLPFTLTYVRRPNGGPGAARNTGLDCLTDEAWVTLLDSDDVWPDNHLQTLFMRAEDNPAAIAVSSLVVRQQYRQGQLTGARVFPHQRFQDRKNIGPEHIHQAFPLSSTTMIKVSALTGLRYDERLRYGEDKLFFAELACRGEWLRVNGTPVMYRNYDVAAGAKQLSNNPHLNSRIRYAHLIERRLAPILAQTRDSQVRKGIKLMLWRGWYRAARQLEDIGHNRWALAYYRQALGYGSPHKTLFRMLVVVRNMARKARSAVQPGSTSSATASPTLAASDRHTRPTDAANPAKAVNAPA